MTQIITKNFVAVAFVVALFSILLAGPQASAETYASSSPTLNSTGTPNSVSCVKAAVEKREGAIMTSWVKFDTSMTAALDARKDSILSAWQLTDTKARAAALKSSATTWKDASKKAHGALKADRKATWTEFKQTMKTQCKVSKLPREDVVLK